MPVMAEARQGYEKYGVWSDQAGGFVGLGPTLAEAEDMRTYLIAQGDDVDDLKIIPECPDHEEEPLVGCSTCDADDDGEEV